ncbi:endothelial lipase [Ambystoma mexicanum]|uniref:endothelial lipase n=1 Tax=Ambystoma mexicanum TaxID=8296 RepID=UPI0037E79768
MRSWALCLSIACLLSPVDLSQLQEEGLLQDNTITDILKEVPEPSATDTPHVKFNAHFSPDYEEQGCFLSTDHDACLEDCHFNTTAKTFFVIHGWTMSGTFERWLETLVSALRARERDCNVVVVDWLPLAHQLYPDAVNNTKSVGEDLAKLLNWLTDKWNFPLHKVHLIGYSLGAHVAGYAGNFVKGTVGRITGLDPAGPMFEGAEPDQRLSPDDADFVDVLHTYTRGALGVSIGIQMPIGHMDVYPNGGDVQPGCGFGDVLGAIAAGSIGEVLKCEHERSVHLFVDSLVHQDKESLAFRCTDSARFKKGICLSCRKNRCNSIGYNLKNTRSKRSSKMYLKTRADMPFKAYHYQMKMHIFSYKTLSENEPSFTVTLYGTNNDTLPLVLEIPDQIGFNFTNTFLVHTEEDVGDLLKIKLSWEGSSQTWTSWWKGFKSYYWSPEDGEKQELHIRRIRVKSGETQKKFTFCAEDPLLINNNITPGGDLWFVKCRDGWEVKRSKRYHLKAHHGLN